MDPPCNREPIEGPESYVYGSGGARVIPGTNHAEISAGSFKPQGFPRLEVKVDRGYVRDIAEIVKGL